MRRKMYARLTLFIIACLRIALYAAASDGEWPDLQDALFDPEAPQRHPLPPA